MTRLHVAVVGYQPREGILPEDYGDFKPGETFTLEEIELMADMGNLPPGLLLQGRAGDKTSRVCVVRGQYYQPEYVEVI